MKKSVSTAAQQQALQNVEAVQTQSAVPATKPRAARKSRARKEVAPQPQAEPAAPEVQPAAQQEARPAAETVKMVDLAFASFMLNVATEKAQLITLPKEGQKEHVRIWVPKSLIHLEADSSNPAKTYCRMPAWLYYRCGLNLHCRPIRWTQVARA